MILTSFSIVFWLTDLVGLGRPTGQEISKNSQGQYETEPIKIQRLMAGQRMKQEENVSFRLKTLCLGQKNSEKNICFPQKKLFFLPSVEKTTIFSSGYKSSPQSFSVPGIKFPPRRNIYSDLHVFFSIKIKLHGRQTYLIDPRPYSTLLFDSPDFQTPKREY